MRSFSRALPKAIAFSLLAASAAVVACSGTKRGDCSNGACVCSEGDSCELTCASPPCAVECLPHSTCEATCSDNDCFCDEGAACDFSCGSGPCHVTCEGDNPSCSGEFWDGTSSCGPGSACAFVCTSPPCHTSCDPGSSCVVDCSGARGGICDITSCGTGSVIMCPDGHTLACNAKCPT